MARDWHGGGRSDYGHGGGRRAREYSRERRDRCNYDRRPVGNGGGGGRRRGRDSRDRRDSRCRDRGGWHRRQSSWSPSRRRDRRQRDEDRRSRTRSKNNWSPRRDSGRNAPDRMVPPPPPPQRWGNAGSGAVGNMAGAGGWDAYGGQTVRSGMTHGATTNGCSGMQKLAAGGMPQPPPPPTPSGDKGGDDAKRRREADDSRPDSSSGSSSGSGGSQEDIVHFDWQEGMVLNGRYSLTSLMGDGTFGRVVAARDSHTKKEIAIKIIRDVKRYLENAKIEADILKDIRKADPDGTSGCAIMYETFLHDSRFYCLVFEPLGTSLYDFLKANDFRGFWMQDIQSFAMQSLKALAFLHERLHLTHTDLKPENVLLQSRDPAQPSAFPRQAEWAHHRGLAPNHTGSQYMRPATSQIKLIDFGNATYANEHHSSIINTRQYRGPEVLLELGWDELSDMWSIGCILMELYTGEQLFATHEELEHLALMDRIIGPLPPNFLDSADKNVQERYLVKSHTGHWRLPWPERASSSSSERHVFSQRQLRQQVPKHHETFGEFLMCLLALNVRNRPSATEALRHNYLSERFAD
eukprot:TRINITY_DN42425_c0_g1_i1.p1 TRINITY_DN42425_c0_g1~~TRINITY_DN42425_c0_g1_i1.p1  ORF type:complete len:579 (-),score=119.96 TRINITY_DN42425_c0_g1_i1:55-1791(-)